MNADVLGPPSQASLITSDRNGAICSLPTRVLVLNAPLIRHIRFSSLGYSRLSFLFLRLLLGFSCRSYSPSIRTYVQAPAPTPAIKVASEP